jgi:hypothetical protein
MYNLIGNKLYQLSTSAPYNNVIHINIKMTASYINYIISVYIIYLINMQKWWGKKGEMELSANV